MNRLIILGASSGIGRCLAETALKSGWKVGITARRLSLLEQIQSQYPDTCFVAPMDVSLVDDARYTLKRLYLEMGGADVIVVNAGVTNGNAKNLWEKDAYTISINVVGFAALSNLSLDLLAKQGHGHLLGISSVAAFLATGRSAAYSASKAFASKFLHGLRARARALKSQVIVTDVKPGFVETDMIAGNKSAVMMISAERAAEILFKNFGKNKAVFYLPARWRFIAWIAQFLPIKLSERIKV